MSFAIGREAKILPLNKENMGNVLKEVSKILDMENSVDYFTVHSNSLDREFGTKRNPIIQILCKAKILFKDKYRGN